MSIINKIKNKLIGKRDIKSNEISNELKYAVEQKPKINLDKYNPFPTPEQLSEQKRSGTIKEEIEKEMGGNAPPPFQPLNMPIKNPSFLQRSQNQNLENGMKNKLSENNNVNDKLDLIIEQLESLRSQNEMILHRIKNLEKRFS